MINLLHWYTLGGNGEMYLSHVPQQLVESSIIHVRYDHSCEVYTLDSSRHWQIAYIDMRLYTLHILVWTCKNIHSKSRWTNIEYYLGVIGTYTYMSGEFKANNGSFSMIYSTASINIHAFLYKSFEYKFGGAHNLICI